MPIATPILTPTLTADRVLRIERMHLAMARLESRGDRFADRLDLARAKRCWRACGRVQHHARRLLVETMSTDEVRRLVEIKTSEILRELAR